MNNCAVIFVCVTLLLRNSCGANVATTRNARTAFKTDVEKAFNLFDWELCKQIYLMEKNVSNLVISPVSVKLVLGMLYLGAGGNTAKELETVLNIFQNGTEIQKKFSHILESLETTTAPTNYELDIGTKLFLDSTAEPKPKYIEQLMLYYKSEIQKLNFKHTAEAVEEINQWAKKVTHGKIQNLVNKDDTEESTVMLLLNAIFFKGYWEKPFATDLTKAENFTLREGGWTEVQMMSVMDKFYYANMAEVNAEIIRLPFLGEKFAMYIVLPYSLATLGSVVRDFNPDVMSRAFQNMTEEKIQLRLPKFHFESTSILAPVLKTMGIKDLFAATANLVDIGSATNGGNLVVSNILQKAGLEVNEQGSTAYAATETQIVNRFGDPVNIFFTVDRPFMFFIRYDESDTIVFVGKVMNPNFAGIPEVKVPIDAPVQNEIGNRVQPQPAAIDSSSAQAAGSPQRPSVYTDDLILSEERSSHFDHEILEEIIRISNGSNALVSSANLKSALSMLWEGSGDKTRASLKALLRIPDDGQAASNLLRKQQNFLKKRNSGMTLESHNRVFVNDKRKLSPFYQKKMRDLYFADVQSANFADSDAATKVINDWVYNSTKSLIPTIVDKGDLDSTTGLFLGSALYFKATWESDFVEKLSKRDCFKKSPDAACLNVIFMNGEKDLLYGNNKAIDAQILELPFSGNQYSMLVLLPNKNLDAVHLQTFVKDLNFNPLKSLRLGLRKTTVDISLPRFTVETYLKMSEVASNLHIADVFSPSANFSGVLDSKDGDGGLRLKEVLHKVKFEVNEKGAKGAAASGSSLMTLSFKPVVKFKANHPFLYFVVDKGSNTVVFEGLLTTPTEGSSLPPSPSPPPPPPRKAVVPQKVRNSPKPTKNKGSIRTPNRTAFKLW